MNRIFRILKQILDTTVYALIGPFAVLYIFPKFFRELETSFYKLPYYFWLDIAGMILMWSGAVIAIWCGFLMILNKYGSVVPFFKPKKLVISGPYKVVRHPMMWSLFMVLIGEAFSFSSVFTVFWLIVWVRFSFIFIAKYEEPFLLRTFGNAYQEYSQKVPCWIPGSKPIPIIPNNK